MMDSSASESQCTGHCGLGLCEHRSDGAWHCHCYEGWHGAHCSTPTGHDLPQDMCNHFRCIHGSCNYGTFTACDCDNGWSGFACDDDGNEHLHSGNTGNMCSTTTCNGQGSCHVVSGAVTCTCNHGYKGNRCETADYCNGHHCINGKCLLNRYYNHYCSCQSGWEGINCETAVHVSHQGSSQCVDDPICHSYINVYDHDAICHSTYYWQHKCPKSCKQCVDHYDTTTTTTSTTTSTTAKPTTPSTTTTTTTTSTTPPPTTTTTSTMPPPTTTTTTTTASTTTSTASAPTTQAVLPDYYNACPKIYVVADILQHTQVSNGDAVRCPSGSHVSAEAFVLNHCNVSLPDTWSPGANVVSSCSSVPLYTPIATFVHGSYSSNGGQSGVFLGCLPDGFKMGVQNCDQDPIIDHVTQGGAYTRDPNVYYTIQ